MGILLINISIKLQSTRKNAVFCIEIAQTLCFTMVWRTDGHQTHGKINFSRSGAVKPAGDSYRAHVQWRTRAIEMFRGPAAQMNKRRKETSKGCAMQPTV